MSKDKIETFLRLTRAAMVKTIKSQPAGTNFYLHVRIDAPVDDSSHFPDGCSSSVKISRNQTIKLAGDLLTDVLEEKGARIPAHVCEYATGYSDKPYRSFWIG